MLVIGLLVFALPRLLLLRLNFRTLHPALLQAILRLARVLLLLLLLLLLCWWW